MCAELYRLDEQEQFLFYICHEHYACNFAFGTACRRSADENGTLEADKFVLIIIIAMGLVTPIIGCMKFTDDLAKVGTILGEVMSILSAPELERPENDIEKPVGCTICFENVRFGYGKTEVLHGIDLTFRGGTVNALVGPSGSGNPLLQSLRHLSGTQAAEK